MMNSIKPILITITCLSVFSFQSCSKDELIAGGEPKPDAEQKILFGIRDTANEQITRGKDVTLDDISKVGIYGYYTANERWTWSADNKPDGLKPNYFCNESLLKSGASGSYSWNYEGQPRFWPPDTRNKVSFFTYSPYVETIDKDGNLINLTGKTVIPYPAVASETGLPVLKYTQPASIANHIDILRASNIDMTKDGADGISGNTDDGIVPIVMEHALTQITFSAQYANPEDVNNYTVTVNSIALSDVFNTGTLRLDNGQWLLDESTAKTSLTIEGSSLAGEVINDGIKVYPLLNSDLGALMMIPQPLTTSNLVVNLTFKDPNPLKEDVTVPISFPLQDTGYKWEPGKSIDYRILIKGGFISVHTTIRTWIEYGSSLSGSAGL